MPGDVTGAVSNMLHALLLQADFTTPAYDSTISGLCVLSNVTLAFFDLSHKEKAGQKS